MTGGNPCSGHLSRHVYFIPTFEENEFHIYNLLDENRVSAMWSHRQNRLSITFILYTLPLNPIRPEKQGQIYIDVNPP